MLGKRSCPVLRMGSKNLARSFVGLGLGLSIGVMSATAANAQIVPDNRNIFDSDDQRRGSVFDSDIPRGETVRSRARPELDALGVRGGGFLVFPSLTGGLSYNDNIFATDGNETDDFIFQIQPNLDVRSDWNNHEVALSVGGDVGFFADNTDENFEDVRASASGRLDIKRSTIARGNIGFAREHEERSDPDDVGGTEPTIFRSYDAGASIRHQFNRVSVSGGGAVRYLDYDDTPTSTVDINNDDRDRLVVSPSVRVGYEIIPSYEAFVRVDGEFTRYDTSRDDAGFKRDSEGFDIVGGAAVDLTGLLFGDFFVGYRQRHFDDSRFDTLRGPVVGSKLTWIPTGLTTVTLDVNSEIVESTQSGSSGYQSTAATVGVDHELLRNLILGGEASIRYDDYEGISREETNYGFGVSADYLWNRYLTLGAAYNFRYRESDAANQDLIRNIVSVFVKAQL